MCQSTLFFFAPVASLWWTIADLLANLMKDLRPQVGIAGTSFSNGDTSEGRNFHSEAISIQNLRSEGRSFQALWRQFSSSTTRLGRGRWEGVSRTVGHKITVHGQRDGQRDALIMPTYIYTCKGVVTSSHTKVADLHWFRSQILIAGGISYLGLLLFIGEWAS